MNRIFQTFLFLLLVFFSLTLEAKVVNDKKRIIDSIEQLNTLNQTLSGSEDEELMDQMLEKENQLLAELMALLKVTTVERLPVAVTSKKLNFLKSRIAANKERNNQLAVKRDQIGLAVYQIRQATRDFIQYLIKASNSYESIDQIVSETHKALTKSQKLSDNIELPEDVLESVVYTELKQNYHQFQQVNGVFQSLVLYVQNNPRSIATTHWFQEFSLMAAISFVNHFDAVKPINHKLAPFKIDVGGVVLSFVIILLVYFSYPVIFSSCGWLVKQYIMEAGSESHEHVYYELRRPVRVLLVFFGIDLATYAFLYKTEYRASLEDFAFVVYTLLTVWILFKILNSLVVVQLQKISRSNKELRRELLNLGIQVAKAVIVIVATAFGLNHFGISITAIMSTLGIGGLAFALAAKDTLSNLFGGVTILFDNVFRMGDWVKVGDVEGTVAEIGLRSTTIRTFDNALITIPNSLVSVSSVMNWNRRAVGRRIKMHVGVTYDSKMPDIRQALDDIRDMLKNHPDIANPKHVVGNRKKAIRLASHEDTHGIKSTQLVYLDKYGDYSIDILIYCFSRTVNWEQWLQVKEDILFKIAEILEQNNLEFAYPTEVRINRNEILP